MKQDSTPDPRFNFLTGLYPDFMSKTSNIKIDIYNNFQ